MTGGRIDQLTEAQRACLRLVLTHHNSKEIAAIFGVSPSAIDKRIERAIQILGVGTRFEAARRLQEHEGADGHVVTQERPAPDAADPTDTPILTYERLPSEPIDVPIPPSAAPKVDQIEPWGLVRRFMGLSQQSGPIGAARNRVSRGDRIVRLIGLMGLIAITSMALVNMAMTLTSLLRANRDHAAPIHGPSTAAPRGR
ncbi:DNA-binding CsgD family transcriptional regulator [Sphingomonas sp. PP-CE-3A-406]|uniref:sigma factor-like helix-turn-helix DNA-binding protein n=1 Tax=Sphingomonas sp. PP-CE-3A-406 TaxID=2135659 RepID=UPI000EF9AE33|nr:sigma factor-like helix-turn-helix DNA-binding protein [Sphingomonas sp. PP-CE-3A-406]RMB54479.1 DNA-binding CsgD family transcriptional regulator [Sphingomonas sp. PP-CE-3A-406]